MGQTLFEYFQLGVPLIFVLILLVATLVVIIHLITNLVGWIKLSKKEKIEGAKTFFSILGGTVIAVLFLGAVIGAVGIGFGLVAHKGLGIALPSEQAAQTNTVQHIDQPHQTAE